MSESIDQALENWWQFKTRNVIAEAEARGEAKGEARGERKGAVAVLSRRVDDGLITVTIADEKAEMTEQGFLKAAETVKKDRESGVRYGIAKGKFNVPDDIDEYNYEIAEMFGVNE